MELVVSCKSCINRALSVSDFLSTAMELVTADDVNETKLITHFYESNKELLHFTKSINKLFPKTKRRASFLEIKSDINTLIKSLDCTSFISESRKMTSLAVLYAIMEGIDKAFPRCINPTEDLGPLDSDENHRYRVYRRLIHSLDADFRDWITRAETKNKSISQRLEHFFFLDMTIWKTKKTNSIPKGYLINSFPEAINFDLISENKQIKIGVTPFCRKHNYRFAKKEAASVRVSYYKDQKKNCAMARRIIEKASDNECDFLIFPEFSTSPSVLETIQKTLSELHSKEKHTPIMTFAGSQWTLEDENQLTILDEEGESLGKYNKYCPYRGENKPTEAFDKAGSEFSFFGCEGLGIFLPAICRDIIDTGYTRELASFILPLLVMDAAYSPSYAYPEKYCRDLAFDSFVSTVFANACSARRDDDIGLCSVISSDNENVPEPIIQPIIRTLGCNNCDEGCLYVAEFFFGHYIDETETKFGAKKSFKMPSLEVNRIDVES